MSTGTTVQVIGAVVDVEFPAGQIPKVYDALVIDDAGVTLEVQQQLGDGVVRTIAMGSTDGLQRGVDAGGEDVVGAAVDLVGAVVLIDHARADAPVVGPVVQEVSGSFDRYWNSEFAVPVSAVVSERLSEQEFQAMKTRFYRWREGVQDFPYPIDTTSEVVMAKLNEFRDDFIWAPARALYDEPDKLVTREEDVADHLIELGAEKDREVMIEAAYVIPGPEGVERTRLNRERGIRQRLLTNSLATNDVAAAHAGYAKYRRDILRNGVELYELRPDANSVRNNWSVLAGR